MDLWGLACLINNLQPCLFHFVFIWRKMFLVNFLSVMASFWYFQFFMHFGSISRLSYIHWALFLVNMYLYSAGFSWCFPCCSVSVSCSYFEFLFLLIRRGAFKKNILFHFLISLDFMLWNILFKMLYFASCMWMGPLLPTSMFTNKQYVFNYCQ